MNIQNTKIELIQWLTTVEDSSLLQKILDIKSTESKDWWNEISETEKKSIQKGVSDADKENLKPHSEARKIYGKWL
ncbi:MAG: hypothetical protein WD048_11545 [Chitinophagales bacterium]